jgi:hypothetical protein
MRCSPSARGHRHPPTAPGRPEPSAASCCQSPCTGFRALIGGDKGRRSGRRDIRPVDESEGHPVPDPRPFGGHPRPAPSGLGLNTKPHRPSGRVELARAARLIDTREGSSTRGRIPAGRRRSPGRHESLDPVVQVELARMLATWSLTIASETASLRHRSGRIGHAAGGPTGNLGDHATGLTLACGRLRRSPQFGIGQCLGLPGRAAGWRR